MGADGSPSPVLGWDGLGLTPVAETAPPAGPRTAADSFLVEEGRVLAVDLHRDRFLDAAGRSQDANTFWAAAVDALPRTGAWFPRFEAFAGPSRPEFRLLLRPSPPLSRSVALVRVSGTEARRSPSVKGPDLDAMLRLRGEAVRLGAGDAVLTTGEGYVIEGATTALAWWRGDVLCTAAPELARVPSVTERVLLTLAAATGTPTLTEHVTANELDGLEVWALNALHGIRIVPEWLGGPALAELPGRLDLWRRRLAALRRPLP